MLLILSITEGKAQKSIIEISENRATVYKPSEEWINNPYSMFVHWGLYSCLGGVWEGKPVKNGYSEQIQSFAGIFSDYYEDLMKDFKAERWCADSIASLSKRSGMHSIIFTSKHHDGFCMYDSKYTDFKITNTPFGRDALKELSESCKKYGLRLGIYYSLIDWHFPQAYPISSHNADPITPQHHDYNKKQVEELLTNYGEISEFWFDMGSLTPEQSTELYAIVKKLQPSCMVSSRLGNDCGDFAVMPDNKIPDYLMGQPWQTPASMFKETWGYRSWQDRGNYMEKAKEKFHELSMVVGRGGHYLLNIGPRGDGSVVEFEKQVLLTVSQWLGHKYQATDVKTPVASKNSYDSFPLSQEKHLLIKRGDIILYDGILKDASKFEVKILDNSVSLKIGKRVVLLDKQNGEPIYCYSSRNYYDSFMKLTGFRWRF